MTDGTHQPDGAAAPGPGPSATPPEPFPGGQPPVPQPGYGYPPQQGGYGYPYETGGYGYPQGQYGPPPAFPMQSGPPTEPDWSALADEAEADAKRKRRRLTAAVVAVAVLLGVGAGVVVVKTRHSGTPVADPSSSASASASASAGGGGSAATVPGDENLLADRAGQAHLAMGPDAQVGKDKNGNVLRLRSNGNSFAQSADRLVDVTKSFSISAWVYCEAPAGARMAISEGDGVSYSFELGRDDTNGKKGWVFRVQTADKGADSTAVEVMSASDTTSGQWALLTGTYDASSKTVALYVNGAPAGTATVPGIWAGPGPLQLGRSRHHGIWGNYWAGVLANVKVWDKALSPAQVASLKDGKADAGAKPTNAWLVG
ncbi:LamG domain-containing protein [Kitasatospora terrestris]|uniref:LamG-like jellyroll fold domain-containing protein n=1 Tax=Kitasatospora terrestris TaxID=258051 RepID=A0ABP9DU93_9ACTN